MLTKRIDEKHSEALEWLQQQSKFVWKGHSIGSDQKSQSLKTTSSLDKYEGFAVSSTSRTNSSSFQQVERLILPSFFKKYDGNNQIWWNIPWIIHYDNATTQIYAIWNDIFFPWLRMQRTHCWKSPRRAYLTCIEDLKERIIYIYHLDNFGNIGQHPCHLLINESRNWFFKLIITFGNNMLDNLLFFYIIPTSYSLVRSKNNSI